METLAYEVRRPRRPAAPPPRWLKIALATGGIPVLLLLLVSLPPARASGALDYPRSIPLAEAVRYALGVDWSDVATDRTTGPMLLFLPFALAALAAFLVSRRPWLTRAALAAALVPPVFCGGPFTLFFPITLFVAAAATLGQCDGEDWSEGFVAIGFLGCWTALWALAALMLTVQHVRERREAVATGAEQQQDLT